MIGLLKKLFYIKKLLNILPMKTFIFLIKIFKLLIFIELIQGSGNASDKLDYTKRKSKLIEIFQVEEKKRKEDSTYRNENKCKEDSKNTDENKLKEDSTNTDENKLKEDSTNRNHQALKNENVSPMK